MPRPRLPPTPESSMDIDAQDGTKHLQELQMSFELPPPGLASPPAEPRTRQFPQFVEYPASQPSETVKSRRRSSTANSRKSDDKEKFELPPPPTRTRKIIHMKPKGQKDSSSSNPPKPSPSKGAASTTGESGASSSTTATTTTATASGNGPASRRKQPSATSAAGKKMARKTAHSLIERRRRSKMNEEFALLKSMIPACTGEMHKLAILQASIEYLRYLEDCVAKLKARQSESPSPEGTPALAPAELDASMTDTHQHDAVVSHCEEVDMADSDSDASASTCTNSRRSSHQPLASPPLLPQDPALLRRESESSVATDGSRCSFSTATSASASASVSASTSPIFAAQLGRSNSYGGLPLPPISLITANPLPEPRDAYREATAALLMLNTERRGSLQPVVRAESTPRDPASETRGISVRDLLST